MGLVSINKSTTSTQKSMLLYTGILGNANNCLDRYILYILANQIRILYFRIDDNLRIKMYDA